MCFDLRMLPNRREIFAVICILIHTQRNWSLEELGRNVLAIEKSCTSTPIKHLAKTSNLGQEMNYDQAKLTNS